MTTINANIISRTTTPQESTRSSSHVRPFRKDSYPSSHRKGTANTLFDLIEEDNDEDNPLEVIQICPSIPHLEQSTTTSTGAIGSFHLPVDIEALFEKMASSMIILSSSLETETSIYLDSPQFSASVFYGTKITIKEFSTAPKAFNVEISTSPLALARLEVHKASLIEAFHKGNFNFSIGRFDTSLQDEDRPTFHRKSPVAEDDQSSEGSP